MRRPAHPLYEQTRRALEELRDLAAARDLLGHLDRAWSRVPLTIGLGGDDLAARTELINAVCGSRVLEARDPGCAPIRIRRGPAARLQARRDDGSTEQLALAARRDEPDAGPVARAEAARARLAEREVALERVETELPVFLRARPAGWRIVLWPIWWLWAWLHRSAIARRTIASNAVEVSRRDLDAVLTSGTTRARDDHARYLDTLRALASARDVVELELEVATGPLDDGIELCELGGLPPSLDVVLVVTPDAIRAPNGELVGSHDQTLATLRSFSEAARAMRLARRARDSIALAVATLDDQVTRTEDDFRQRIATLEARRLANPTAFIADQLARIRPQIVTSVSVVIEHASVHLGAELAALGAEWITGIANASTSDALKEVVTHIETTATASAQRIADETRRLALNGASGVAHDLYAELVSALVPLGLPEELRASRAAPALPPIEVMPSLAAASIAKLSGQWLGGLFKSFESRRTDVREKTHQQIEQLRELATDELLDVEPRLHAAIEQVLAPQLVAACEHQEVALAAALTAEYAAIDADRARLAPTLALRDLARTTVHDLRDHIATLEAALPACAAASAAVAD